MTAEEILQELKLIVGRRHVLTRPDAVSPHSTGYRFGGGPALAVIRPKTLVETWRTARVCIEAGAARRLYDLERKLEPLNRDPHSIIGSSCVGATVIGGICNNSGGALVQRGPAFTELALFAQLDETGSLRLVNHLGIRLGDRPEVMLDRLGSEPSTFGRSARLRVRKREPRQGFRVK